MGGGWSFFFLCVCLSRRLKLSSTELESGNTIGAFLQNPAPVLNKLLDPWVHDFLSSTGLGSGNLIGRAQIPPAPALDKNRSPGLSYAPRGFSPCITGDPRKFPPNSKDHALKLRRGGLKNLWGPKTLRFDNTDTLRFLLFGPINFASGCTATSVYTELSGRNSFCVILRQNLRCGTLL